MALQFPSASVGQQYQSGSSSTYEWNGSYWIVVQPASVDIINSLSASFALTASYVSGSTTGGDSISSSWASSSLSSSVSENAATASFITGSNVVGEVAKAVSSSLAATASSADALYVRNNLTVNGVLSASIFYANSQSVISGSNTFGSTTENTQTIIGSTTISGSLTIANTTRATIDNLTGSLFGTASWAESVVTASYAKTASYVVNALSASFVTGSNVKGIVSNATSASSAETSSWAIRAISASYADDLEVAGDLEVKGVLSASVFYAESASIAFTSGSNVLGNTLTNTQQLTGSVGITGSLILNAATKATMPNLTGSLFGTASLATTASYIQTAQTASFITASNVSGIVASASVAISSSRAISASFAPTNITYGGSLIPARADIFGVVDLVTINLPSAGTWKITRYVRAIAATNNTIFLTFLADSANNELAISRLLGSFGVAGLQVNCSMVDFITISNPATYKLRAFAINNLGGVASDSNGVSKIIWEKIA